MFNVNTDYEPNRLLNPSKVFLNDNLSTLYLDEELSYLDEIKINFNDQIISLLFPIYQGNFEYSHDEERENVIFTSTLTLSQDGNSSGNHATYDTHYNYLKNYFIENIPHATHSNGFQIDCTGIVTSVTISDFPSYQLGDFGYLTSDRTMSVSMKYEKEYTSHYKVYDKTIAFNDLILICRKMEIFVGDTYYNQDHYKYYVASTQKLSKCCLQKTCKPNEYYTLEEINT